MLNTYQHRNLDFSAWHIARLNAGEDAALPLVPDGAGDLYYAQDTEILYIANAAGTAWNRYDFSTVITVAALTNLDDVGAAAQESHYVLSVRPTPPIVAFNVGFSTGFAGWFQQPVFPADPAFESDAFDVGFIVGSQYRGRRLVAADLPILSTSKFTSGVLPRARGGLELGSFADGDFVVANNAGALVALPAASVDGYYITVDTSANPQVQWRPITTFIAAVGVAVANSGSGNVSSGSVTTFAFGATRYDTDDIHNPLSNSSRLTCNTAGKYRIWGTIGNQVNISGPDNPQSSWYTDIYLNGSTVIAKTSGSMNISTVYDLAEGDYVELRFFQDSGSTYEYTSVQTTFGMYRIAIP